MVDSRCSAREPAPPVSGCLGGARNVGERYEVLLWGDSHADAFAPGGAIATAVPGFDGGIRWGAAKEEVNTFWREDPAAESREGSISMIAYKPWQQMNWTVYVDDARGLIGLYAVSLPGLDASACERVFDGLVRAMRASFPGVEPTGEKREAGGEDFCPAVRAGHAQGGYTWAEPGTGVRARVWVQPATGQVGYMMGTTYFQDWSVERQAQQAAPARPAPAQAAAPAQQQPARNHEQVHRHVPQNDCQQWQRQQIHAMRVGDPHPIDGMRGTMQMQVGVPRIELVHGVSDKFWLEVAVRAAQQRP